jgi:hypothetical protein
LETFTQGRQGEEGLKGLSQISRLVLGLSTNRCAFGLFAFA